MSHQCPIPGCNTIISSSHLMCVAHWSRVPWQLQARVHKTKGTPAHQAARQLAISYVTPKPKPKKPLPRSAGFQACCIAGFLTCLALLTQGCMVARYNRVLPCGDQVRFTVWSCLANDRATEICVDKTTKTTTTGITIGEVNHEIDDEAVKAIAQGVTTAVLEALKHP